MERREQIDWMMLEGVRVCGRCEKAGLPSVSGARDQWPDDYDGERCRDCGQWVYALDRRSGGQG